MNSLTKTAFELTHGIKLSTFVESYIDCALWTGVEPLEDDGRDKEYDLSPLLLADETLKTILADCATFVAQAGEFTEEMCGIYPAKNRTWTMEEQAGHDFWLTRNGHGAGFWDGDWREGDDTRLTGLARSFGEQTWYIGDDGRVYID